MNTQTSSSFFFNFDDEDAPRYVEEIWKEKGKGVYGVFTTCRWQVEISSAGGGVAMNLETGDIAILKDSETKLIARFAQPKPPARFRPEGAWQWEGTPLPPRPPAPTSKKEEIRKELLKGGKAAYRRLALQYHPDTGGSHEAFLLLQEVWESIL